MTIFLCGPEEMLFAPSCWNCEGPIPDHVTDRRFCGHECGIEWDEHMEHQRLHGGPCTFCGQPEGQHPVKGACTVFCPMSADRNQFLAASEENRLASAE